MLVSRDSRLTRRAEHTAGPRKGQMNSQSLNETGAPSVENPYADLRLVNLASDTQTRPTAEMRDAIAKAVVGDEQSFADPTVNELLERVAALLGHEAAVFLPSGTMCNEIGVRLHVGHAGDELLAERSSHILNFEAGGPAALSSAVLATIDGDRGVFTGAQLEERIRLKPSRYTPIPRLVCAEQTAALGGGRVWPLETLRDVAVTAHRHGLRSHLDGARLFNASVASGVPVKEYASEFDTAWVDFSKGLGAPVGAVLVGTRELIDQAWRYKQMWGGAMRQAGVLAAAALYALDHHVERLAIDHENAKRLAAGLEAIDRVAVDVAAVETNIVYFEVPDAPAFVERLRTVGVLVEGKGPRRVRAVTHLDVTQANVDAAIDAVETVMEQF